MTDITNNTLTSNKNKKREIKRRYQCNNKFTRKNSRMNEEVATDFKVKQFLNDVEKFSERSQRKQEERNTKFKISNKAQEKRGIFENGMISKPSVKGILGTKNKARLTGNLESLLDQGEKTIPISSEDESSLEPDESRMQCPESAGASSYDYKDEGKKLKHKKLKNTNEQKEAKLRKMCDINKSSESEVQDCGNYKKYEFDILREDVIQRCRKGYMSFLQKSFLENALKDEDGLLNNFKNIFNEYILSQKAKMVDKCVQTDIADFESPIEESNDSNIHLDDPGLPLPENPHFIEDLKNKELDGIFSFQPKNQSKCEKSSVKKNVIFERKGNLIETPKIFKTKDFPEVVEEVEKPYIPIILSPLSPGRKYASIFSRDTSDASWKDKGIFSDIENIHASKKYPFIQPLKQRPFSNFIQTSPSCSKQRILPDSHSRISNKNMIARQSFCSSAMRENQSTSNNFNPTFHKRLNNSHFTDFDDSKDLRGLSSSSQSNFSCPKKRKLTFSPHRL